MCNLKDPDPYFHFRSDPDPYKSDPYPKHYRSVYFSNVTKIELTPTSLFGEISHIMDDENKFGWWQQDLVLLDREGKGGEGFLPIPSVDAQEMLKLETQIFGNFF